MSWKSQIFASLIVITRKRHLYLCTIVSKQSKRNRKSYQMNKSIKINFMFARSQTVEFISVPKVSIILCASCTVARSEGAQCWAIWSKKRWYFWILCTGFIRYEESERGCPLTNFKCTNVAKRSNFRIGRGKKYRTRKMQTHAEYYMQNITGLIFWYN